MIKYFYKGQSLSKYCKKKGYNYDRIKQKLNSRDITVEIAVKEYLEDIKSNKRIIRNALWKLSDGRNLKQACIKEKVCYRSVLNRVYKGMNIDVAFKQVKSLRGKKGWNASKYFINGIPLLTYCKKNNIGYYCILLRIKNKNMSVEEAIENYKNSLDETGKIKQYHKLFLKNGKPLVDACREEGVCYSTVKGYLRDKEKKDIDYAFNYAKRHKKIYKKLKIS